MWALPPARAILLLDVYLYTPRVLRSGGMLIQAAALPPLIPKAMALAAFQRRRLASPNERLKAKEPVYTPVGADATLARMAYGGVAVIFGRKLEGVGCESAKIAAPVGRDS
jgi:hypothetical protein